MTVPLTLMAKTEVNSVNGCWTTSSARLTIWFVTEGASTPSVRAADGAPAETIT